jgi:hypothetical protein
MKITELIARLEEILRTDGDLVVTCWPYDGQATAYDPEIKVYETDEEPPRWFAEIDGIPRSIL